MILNIFLFGQPLEGLALFLFRVCHRILMLPVRLPAPFLRARVGWPPLPGRRCCTASHASARHQPTAPRSTRPSRQRQSDPAPSTTGSGAVGNHHEPQCQAPRIQPRPKENRDPKKNFVKEFYFLSNIFFSFAKFSRGFRKFCRDS